MRETIIQFGEGVFLRGFFNDFLNTLNQSGLYDGKAVVIQPRAGGKVAKLNEQNCRYHLFLRGIENGEPMAEHREIRSISRGIDPYKDFAAYMTLADSADIRFVVSNTTEAGIAFDDSCKLTDTPCLSFPGKLTQLLYRRYQNGLKGLIFLPCELIDNNADALKSCILRYAKLWDLEQGFTEWIETENTFANTLVDRIVTGYPEAEKETMLAEIGCEDLYLNTAERFGLWVIEGNFEEELPLQKAGIPVIWTNDASPYKKRKVRVLNGAHTSTVFPALLGGVETVGEAMAHPAVRALLEKNLYAHILPMLGETQENLAFTAAVLDRFSNPYIRHKWQAISLNSISKFTVRVLPTMLDCKAARGDYPKSLVFSLACLIRYYKENDVSDDPTLTAKIKTGDIKEILADTALWGCDLSDACDAVHEALAVMKEKPMEEAIAWAIS